MARFTLSSLVVHGMPRPERLSLYNRSCIYRRKPGKNPNRPRPSSTFSLYRISRAFPHLPPRQNHCNAFQKENPNAIRLNRGMKRVRESISGLRPGPRQIRRVAFRFLNRKDVVNCLATVESDGVGLQWQSGAATHHFQIKRISKWKMTSMLV